MNSRDYQSLREFWKKEKDRIASLNLDELYEEILFFQNDLNKEIKFFERLSKEKGK